MLSFLHAHTNTHTHMHAHTHACTHTFMHTPRNTKVARTQHHITTMVDFAANFLAYIVALGTCGAPRKRKL